MKCFPYFYINILGKLKEDITSYNGIHSQYTLAARHSELIDISDKEDKNLTKRNEELCEALVL